MEFPCKSCKTVTSAVELNGTAFCLKCRKEFALKNQDPNKKTCMTCKVTLDNYLFVHRDDKNKFYRNCKGCRGRWMENNNRKPTE